MTDEATQLQRIAATLAAIEKRLAAIEKRLPAIHAAADRKDAERWERKQRGEPEPPLQPFKTGSFIATPKGE